MDWKLIAIKIARHPKVTLTIFKASGRVLRIFSLTRLREVVELKVGCFYRSQKRLMLPLLHSMIFTDCLGKLYVICKLSKSRFM